MKNARCRSLNDMSAAFAVFAAFAFFVIVAVIIFFVFKINEVQRSVIQIIIQIQVEFFISKFAVQIIVKEDIVIIEIGAGKVIVIVIEFAEHILVDIDFVIVGKFVRILRVIQKGADSSDRRTALRTATVFGFDIAFAYFNIAIGTGGSVSLLLLFFNMINKNIYFGYTEFSLGFYLIDLRLSGSTVY